MKNARELLRLAEEHGIKTTQRRWFERRDERTGEWETAFMDLPRPREEIADDLRVMGVLR